jgi:glycosyltransferase involved in cell wall biosynthesis
MLDPWFKQKYPLKHLKKWLYWPWGEYRVLRDAKAVLFTCEEERLLARKSFWLYKCNEAVVSLGIDAPPGDENAQRELFFNKFPELRGKRLILFLGRIHPKKGCDLLIKAFAQPAKEEPLLHLVIAGPDQVGWQGKLQKLSQKLRISDRITWTGMLSGDLKCGAVHSSEVFILPSHQENFGIAVAEALACGVPVLISNKVNIWREIKAAGAGLVARDDLQGTAELLAKWIAMPHNEQQTMRQKAKTCFLERFEIHKAVKSLLEVIKKYK